MLFYPPIEFFFCFVLISPIFCFPLIRAQMLHRLKILSVLVLILLLAYYHAYVLLLEHCHFVCFQFFFLTLWFTRDLDAHFFVWSLSFPLEWVMWKYCHCVLKIGDSWDDCNRSLIFNSGPGLWPYWDRPLQWLANTPSQFFWFHFSTTVCQSVNTHVYQCSSNILCKTRPSQSSMHY